MSVALLAVACTAAPSDPVDDDSYRTASGLSRIDGGTAPRPFPSTGSFVIRALGNRCWDIGGRTPAVGSPIIISACASRAARQMFRVDELDATHDFQLVAEGGLCVGANAAHSLELQACTQSQAQRFAFDGDAILMGGVPTGGGPRGTEQGGRVTRELAVTTLEANTNENTPVVVARRELSDAEYWRMLAVDGSNRKPTTGFVTASSYPELDAQLRAATWGTVVELSARSTVIDVPGVHWGDRNVVKEGVTLRGGRKFLDSGVELRLSPTEPFPTAPGVHSYYAFAVRDRGRATGLGLKGPGFRAEQVAGLLLERNYDGGQTTVSFVDRVEAYDWNHAAVAVIGAWPAETASGIRQDFMCNAAYHAAPFAHVVGNFFHHASDNRAYGVDVAMGGYASVRRTLMFDNPHEVTSDGIGMTRYDVVDNLFTSYMRRAPYADGTGPNFNQEIDVHGRCDPGGWVGGRAGDLFDVGFNTLLAWRDVMQVRGTPCRHAWFHDNVTTQPASRVSVDNPAPTDVTSPCFLFQPGPDAAVIVKERNQFQYPDPTREWTVFGAKLGNVGVGDFDGDGIDDVFLGTGVTWWFSSGGKAEWRFLNRMPERASQLRFGDFDGDGRTDVVSVSGGRARISWAGLSRWFDVASPVISSIADVAVGDFDGDRVADLFVTDGTAWWWAPRASAFQYFATSGYRATNLRFGNFVESWRTNVLGYVSGRWRVVRSPNGTWEDFGPAYDTNVAGLVAADFNNDGATDLAKTDGTKWVASWGGRTSFTQFATVAAGDLLAALPVGQFDGQPGVDVLVWRDTDFPGVFDEGPPSSKFAKYSGGQLTDNPWSRQTMR